MRKRRVTSPAAASAASETPVTEDGQRDPSSAAPDASPAASPARRVYAGTGILPLVIAAILFGVVLIAFVAQNSERIQLELFWFDFRLSPAVLVLASMLIAVVADEVFGLMLRRRRRGRLQDREELERLRQKVGTRS
jgi:uncharacterized integral membrane protein